MKPNKSYCRYCKKEIIGNQFCECEKRIKFEKLWDKNMREREKQVTKK